MQLESKPVDVEYVRLFHDIHSEDVNNHLYRGYTLLPPRGIAENPTREIKAVSGAKRPIWFVFSGMGSQWAGMGIHIFLSFIFVNPYLKLIISLHPYIFRGSLTTFTSICRSYKKMRCSFKTTWC